MSTYKGASYQQDVILELTNQANVFKYGPGFSGFDNNDTLVDILGKSHVQPDFLLLAHSWLPDSNANPFFLPNCDFNVAAIPMVAILNKEYVNLKNKISYLKGNKCRLIFSHHHDAKTIGHSNHLPAVFWPFAYDEKKIVRSRIPRPITLGFSGILKNQLSGAEQTDSRLRVMQEIFVCWNDLPIRKRSEYADLTFFWNAMPRTAKRNSRLWGQRLQKCIFPKYGYHYLEDTQYFEVLSKSKLFFNSLSPMGLIGPRFFETMASGAVVVAERESAYREVFPDGVLIQFDENLSNFSSLVKDIANDDEKWREMSSKGRGLVFKHHQWRHRVRDLIGRLSKLG
jgi:hypothetical protein